MIQSATCNIFFLYSVSYYIRKHDYKVQSDYRRIEDDVDPTEDTDEVRLQFKFAF